MLNTKTLSTLIGICLSVQIVLATNPDTVQLRFDQQKMFFNSAKNELENMLSGKQALDYERAVFITENAYWDNSYSYSSFQNVINYHLSSIEQIYFANNTKSEKDFKADWFETAQIKKQKYETLLKNWAIYKYITDTTHIVSKNLINYHLPYLYSNNDPFGTEKWGHSQVFNLIGNENQTTGNCYALSAFYKIFAERLNTDAQIATAPGHIYIVHKDEKDITYNIELASRTFPGNGSEAVLTYTTDQAVKSGIAMRYLDLKQSVALNLIYLAKGYQNKFKNNTDNFILDCADLTLKYDSLNLNAMLLKAEVLEKKVIEKNKEIAQLQSDKEFIEYQKLIKNLYSLGYREMPLEMKNILISGYRQEDAPIFLTDHTPSASKSLGIKHDKNYITLSNGLFDEMHEKKDFEKYSKIVFDTKKNKIVGFVSKDSTYNNYNFDPVLFALSVDPLQSKYPDLSPYNFVGNNPIFLVDKDGREIVVHYKLNGEDQTIILKKTSDIELLKNVKSDNDFVENVYASIEYLNDSKRAEKTINRLITAKRDINIVESDNTETDFDPIGYTDKNDPSLNRYKRQLKYSTKWGLVSTKGKQSPALGFLHDLKHAKNWLNNPIAYTLRGLIKAGKNDNLEEKNATKEEKKVAVELNEMPAVRDEYDEQGIDLKPAKMETVPTQKKNAPAEEEPK